MKGRVSLRRGRGIVFINKPRPLSSKISKISKPNRLPGSRGASKATRFGLSAPPQRRLAVLLDGSAILNL
jgi:hypothetical protein